MSIFKSLTDQKPSESTCRICLTTVKDKGLSLFEKFRDHFVYTYIHTITEVRICENDGHPMNICNQCLLELDTAVQFKEKCETSNKILLELATKVASPSCDDMILDIKEDSSQIESLVKQEYLYEQNFSDAEYDNNEIVGFDANSCENDFNATEIRQLQCHDCGEYFRTKCKLRVHWKRTHLAQSCLKVCERCKMSFKTLHAYKNHLKNETKRCRALGDELIRIEGLGKNRIFYCKECDYKTTYLPNIIHHSAKHSGKRQYQCDLCPKAFIQYASWSKHKEYTHKQFKQIITCHLCGKVVNGGDNFKRHLKTHSKEKNFQCDICKKKYKTKYTLQNHMNCHSEKNFTCEICAKVFHMRSGLWTHIQYVHKRQNRQMYKCSICDYKAIKLYNIKKHERKHSDNNVACPHCGKFFEKAEKMLKHKKIHFAEKKFQCRECEKKYLSLDSLHKHLKGVHGVKLS